MTCAILFEQSARVNAVTAAIIGTETQRVFETLRQAHIEPLLLKGWAVARMYVDASLRPLGDIDLAVAPTDYAKAVDVLGTLPLSLAGVDLHAGLPEFHAEPHDGVFARSRLVRLEASHIRVLAPEDQLRLLCLHFLRHGGWRPLWLCDVAVMLESLPKNFDWDLCLHGRRRIAHQVALVCQLAVALLATSVAKLPPVIAATCVPRWLTRATLKQWGSPYDRYSGMALRDHFRLRRDRVAALRRRWPNPIEATIAVGGPFNDLPRLPFQLAACGARGLRAAAGGR
ncbi:MAG: hypothetical protein NVS4B3_09230 [Gemmatimonadaceae bacterium]